ncbi:MAG: alkaline phosphatase family protein [Candidatus Sericytochromatia bacterium]
MKKTFLSLLSLSIIYSCNTSLERNNKNIPLKQSGKVVVNIKPVNESFKVKSINFSDPNIKKMKVVIKGNSINNDISQTLDYETNKTLSFNLNVPVGLNRIVYLYGLDSTDKELFSLMGLANVEAGKNTISKVDFFETSVAKVFENLLNQKSDLLDKLDNQTVRDFIKGVSGFDDKFNTYIKIHPLQVNQEYISKFLIDNKGTLPSLNAEDLLKKITDHVLIISIDGLMPDVLLNTNTPKLNNLWKEGSSTFKAQTIFPSITLPSHTSMLTGLKFENHKVDWNDYQPTKSITSKTIFHFVKEKGLTTSAFTGKEKFRHFETFVDKFDLSTPYTTILNNAESYIKSNKPNLTFVHLPEIDSVGHSKKWQSIEQKTMLEEMDQPIGNFIQNATNEIPDLITIVTADHGGHDFTHGSDLAVDMTIPWIARGKMIKKDYKINMSVNTYDTAVTAMSLLGVNKYSSMDGKPISDIIDF